MSDPVTPRTPASSTPLLPPNWGDLSPLVDAVLDAPLDRRDAVLARVSADDPARRAAIEHLVAECERDGPLFNRPAAERFAGLLVDAQEPQLPETLGGRYQIGRELGRGGMALVYLARDIKHGRDVAVKVIRPDLAASLGRARFLREIGIAARLRQPNIVPLYDSGDADGVLYFVMPYEEGPSLRERLRRDGKLPVTECVSVLRDVARALAYAHERGVVHRDVKPDNVMMSGRAAVVTDFGIAKAVSVAQETGSGATMTQAGAGIGTPAYMAPEQAIGDPATDHRADIYSFGCLAYELFTGKPPFHDMPTHAIIAAHVATTPVPVTASNPQIPEPIARLIARCLEKAPAARPQSALDVLAELESGQTEPNELPVRRRRPIPWVLLGAVAVVTVVSLAGYVVWHGRTLTISVLPLTSAVDATQRDLAFGMSEEIATGLLNVPGVRVMSRRGVAQYGNDREVDPEKMGRELGAQYLVTGSLREANGRLRVLASVVQTSNGALVWAEQFDRPRDELGLVRDDIVRSVADLLLKKLGRSVDRRALVAERRPANLDAFRLKVLAQQQLTRRGLSIQASVDNFRRATELDTMYAEAYAGLSLALALSPYFRSVSAAEVAPEATRNARRALLLDSTLAQPHVTLGLVQQHTYHQWDSAATEFRTALRLDSLNFEARLQYGRHLLFRGRVSDGMAQFRLARRTEPASAVVASWVAYAYYLEGQLDSASVEIDRAFQSDSTNVTTLNYGSLIRFKERRLADALGFAARGARTNGITLYILAAAGDSAEVMERLRELDGGGPNVWHPETRRAQAMLGLGDTTAALDALERATDAGEFWWSLNSIRDPMYDSIRASARYQRLLRRVGL